MQVEDTLLGKQRRIPVDMVILMGALEPQADAKEMGLKCGISCSMAGWYTERHPEARPRGHDDRRRVRGRRVPGTEGHSRLGGPRRRGGRPRRTA